MLLCVGKNDRIGKRKENILAKDKWEIPAVIPLMPIVGVNHHLPILRMSKIMVHIYTTGKTINQFSIGYMINPWLKFRNEFRTKFEKLFGGYFSIRTMKAIKNCLMKNNTSVMALIMVYEKNREIPKTL